MGRRRRPFIHGYACSNTLGRRHAYAGSASGSVVPGADRAELARPSWWPRHRCLRRFHPSAPNRANRPLELPWLCGAQHSRGKSTSHVPDADIKPLAATGGACFSAAQLHTGASSWIASCSRRALAGLRVRAANTGHACLHCCRMDQWRPQRHRSGAGRTGRRPWRFRSADRALSGHGLRRVLSHHRQPR